MFSHTYSWALRRVFKFVLRRVLGKVLKNELNLEQLDVALGSGTLELRDVALNCDYIRRHLGAAAGGVVTLEEGHVGWVRATVPWNALGAQPCVVEIGELDLVVAPNGDAGNERRGGTEGGLHAAAVAAAIAANEESAAGESDGERGRRSDAVDDGVQLIARALEGILRGLCFRAVDVTVRVNAAPCDWKPRAASDSPALLLRLDELDFRDRPLEREGEGGSEETTQEKVVTFKGFSVEVADCAGGADDGVFGAGSPREPLSESERMERSGEEDDEVKRDEERWSGDGDEDGEAECDGWSVSSTLPREPEWCVIVGGRGGRRSKEAESAPVSAGVSGVAAARLTWASEEDAVAARPPVAVDVSLELAAVRLRAGPAQIAALARVAAAFDAAAQSRAAASSRPSAARDEDEDEDTSSSDTVSSVDSEEWASPAAVAPVTRSIMHDLWGDDDAASRDPGGETAEALFREVEQSMQGISDALESTGANVVDLVSHAWSAMRASSAAFDARDPPSGRSPDGRSSADEKEKSGARTPELTVSVRLPRVTAEALYDDAPTVGRDANAWDAAFLNGETTCEHLCVEARSATVTAAVGDDGVSLHVRLDAMDASEYLRPAASGLGLGGGGLRHVGGAAMGVLGLLPRPPTAPWTGGKRASFAPKRRGDLARAPLLHVASSAEDHRRLSEDGDGGGASSAAVFRNGQHAALTATLHRPRGPVAPVTVAASLAPALLWVDATMPDRLAALTRAAASAGLTAQSPRGKMTGAEEFRGGGPGWAEGGLHASLAAPHVRVVVCAPLPDTSRNDDDNTSDHRLEPSSPVVSISALRHVAAVAVDVTGVRPPPRSQPPREPTDGHDDDPPEHEPPLLTVTRPPADDEANPPAAEAAMAALEVYLPMSTAESGPREDAGVGMSGFRRLSWSHAGGEPKVPCVLLLGREQETMKTGDDAHAPRWPAPVSLSARLQGDARGEEAHGLAEAALAATARRALAGPNARPTDDPAGARAEAAASAAVREAEAAAAAMDIEAEVPLLRCRFSPEAVRAAAELSAALAALPEGNPLAVRPPLPNQPVPAVALKVLLGDAVVTLPALPGEGGGEGAASESSWSRRSSLDGPGEGGRPGGSSMASVQSAASSLFQSAMSTLAGGGGGGSAAFGTSFGSFSAHPPHAHARSPRSSEAWSGAGCRAGWGRETSAVGFRLTDAEVFAAMSTGGRPGADHVWIHAAAAAVADLADRDERSPRPSETSAGVGVGHRQVRARAGGWDEWDERREALVMRAHPELTTEAGVVAAAARVPGMPSAVAVTLSGAVASLAKPRPSVNRDDSNVASEHDVTVHLAVPALERALAAAAATAAAAGEALARVASNHRPPRVSASDDGAETTLGATETAAPSPIVYASLDVRESAAVLTGWSTPEGGSVGGGDQSGAENNRPEGQDCPGGGAASTSGLTMRRGVVRLDTLSVSIVPSSESTAPPATTGEAAAREASTSTVPTHPASTASDAMSHSMLLEGASLHVAAPIVVTSAVVDGPFVLSRVAGFPCTSAALRAAGLPCVAREAAVQGAARTGGGQPPLATLRTTNLRLDVRHDSLAAASAFAQAVTAPPAAVDIEPTPPPSTPATPSVMSPTGKGAGATRDHGSFTTLGLGGGSGSAAPKPNEEAFVLVSPKDTATFGSSASLPGSPAAMAAGLSSPKINVAPGRVVLDTVDEHAFDRRERDARRGGDAGRDAGAPDHRRIIEDYYVAPRGAPAAVENESAPQVGQTQAEQGRRHRAPPRRARRSLLAGVGDASPRAVIVSAGSGSPRGASLSGRGFPSSSSSNLAALSGSIHYAGQEAAAREALRAMRLSWGGGASSFGAPSTMSQSTHAALRDGSASVMSALGLPPRPARRPPPAPGVTKAPGRPVAPTDRAGWSRESSPPSSPPSPEPAPPSSPPSKASENEHDGISASGRHGQTRECSARWFSGAPPVTVDPNHVPTPAAPEVQEVGASGAPVTPPPLPGPLATAGAPATAAATVTVARVECNLHAGTQWGRRPRDRGGQGHGREGADERGGAEGCAGMRIVVKGAALRADEFAREGPDAVLAWRAAVAVADFAVLDLTPASRCRWPRVLSHDASVRERRVFSLRKRRFFSSFVVPARPPVAGTLHARDETRVSARRLADA